MASYDDDFPLDTLTPEKLLEFKSVPKSIKGNSYFSEYHARKLISYLDQIISTDRDLRLRFDRFNLAPDSLYTWVTISWRYVNLFLDPTGKYFNLKEQCDITNKAEDEGVCIRRIYIIAPEIFRVADEAPSRLDKQKEEIKPWKKELQSFMENSKPNDLHNPSKLDLSTDDILWIDGIMTDDFRHKVSDNGKELLVIRIR